MLESREMGGKHCRRGQRVKREKMGVSKIETVRGPIKRANDPNENLGEKSTR